ncbi:type IV pilin-like G/H family protein [Tychonema sp. LEGE 07199]|uniref:type IV pilin-like G/H family protein n=1 Tax=unclassified Tychonema TaxID=2642144 RepID=UPI00187F3627|nr:MULTISPECIES: type IV pilin-like G/H family protein [unclassified Tychonema]MBE9120873.1 type IV pilin-like G/H family protein [Tychonema sp. LEGE 07199]MBE9134022.1 type IV pilin-like G/H family protein [Tychonema sp. LEGE 07196]
MTNFRIDNFQPWQIGVILTILILSVIFSKVSEAQLSQTVKAEELAARQYVSWMNRAQQGYYAETAKFTNSVANLGIGIKSENANYKYSISTENNAVFSYGVSRNANLKSFVGGVFLIENTIQQILCQANAASTTKPANPTNNNGTLACGANTIEVSQLSPTVKASEADETEGKQYVGSMNKAQQAYYLENGEFTNSVPNLGLGIRTETANYKYSISTENKAVFHYGVSKQGKLKSFVGGVFLIGDATTKITVRIRRLVEGVFLMDTTPGITTVRILCQTNAVSTTKPASPTNNNGTLACGANTVEVVR